MPGRDRTGPEGKGPATGGGRGNCQQKVDNDVKVSEWYRQRPARLRGLKQQGDSPQFTEPNGWFRGMGNGGCGRKLRWGRRIRKQ